MDSAALDDPRTSSMKPLLLHCLLQMLTFPPLKILVLLQPSVLLSFKTLSVKITMQILYADPP